MVQQPYLGRFAPSPTGPLHYGSLVTAVASYLQARANAGSWHIRIENIDPPREQSGAISSILQTLDDYGFYADRKPILQNHRIDQHKHQALRLFELHYAYVCECSRSQLTKISEQGNMGSIYPGTCQDKKLSLSTQSSIRVRTNHSKIKFLDRVFGQQEIDLRTESGDYVIYRRNDLPSYILAVSVDDIYEQYTEIVRGHDLLAITSRQIHLSNLIGGRVPAFMHIPIITNDAGDKLSKHTHAPALTKYHARDMLLQALIDLGQDPPKNLSWRPLWVIWKWAIRHWQPQYIPVTATIPYRL